MPDCTPRLLLIASAWALCLSACASPAAAPTTTVKDAGATDTAAKDLATETDVVKPGADVINDDVAVDTAKPACTCGDGSCDASCNETTVSCPADCTATGCLGGGVAACDDKNACTKDVCGADGTCSHTAAAGQCSDGNACTAKDTCSGSKCQGGAALVCDDGNDCTDDSCDPATGCIYVANSAPCSDDDVCTDNDACALGLCKGGKAVACDDFNACTKDICQQGKGCVSMPQDGTVCTDGDACTSVDACIDGQCVGTAVLQCEDDQLCTLDGCDKNIGCIHTNFDMECDDGDPCTTGDACIGGVCAGPGSLDCLDTNPCTDDGCAKGSGCTHVANTAPCDDKNACSTDDMCGDSLCIAGTVTTCDDANPCTDDSCNPLSGCGHVANSLPCSDGNACTISDVCAAAVCVPGAVTDCDDDNACTDDSCDSGVGCINTATKDPCSDNSACTVGDTCAAGACVPGNPLECADNQPCTADSCDPASGCLNLPTNATCSDDNACTTTDICVGGACVGSDPALCVDPNPCTDDSCAPATGCVFTTNSAPCSDGDACTLDDGCQNKLCVSGSTVPCDDHNACTADSCDLVSGCSNLPIEATCTDGDACTTGDACDAKGKCAGGPAPDCDDANPCTDDSCNSDTGCVHAANGAPCDDKNACTTADTCSLSACKGGPAKDCTDDNVCTDDLCEPVFGCFKNANTAPCQDGSACTEGDTCAGGTCGSGSAIVCNDDNPCTNDSCNVSTGCVFAANSLPCDDKNTCTTADTCAAKACVGGPKLNCDDGNTCSTDGCDPASGCTHAANTLPCSDGSVCTTVDTCTSMTCVGAVPLSCNDNKICTFDLCNALTGCSHPPAVYFGDDFATDLKGWAMESDWMIGPAQVSIPFPQYNTPPNMFTSGFPDPKTDHTPTSDNGEAGTMIGGYTLRMLAPTAYMTSPEIDLSNVQTDVYLQYWRYVNTDYTGYMDAFVEIWDGQAWVQLVDYASSATTDEVWTAEQFNVSKYKNANFKVRFAFGVTSTDAMSMSGWNLDDVRLVPATTCPW